MPKLILVGVLAVTLWPSFATAGPKPKSGALPTCRLPTSNAEALVILSNFYPGY